MKTLHGGVRKGVRDGTAAELVGPNLEKLNRKKVCQF